MGLSVLIVDDDESVRFFHRVAVLQSQLATEPVCFKDGREVFDYLNEQPETTTDYLILLDINMPQMDAWEFLESIKDKDYSSRVKIVMISSSPDLADYKKASTYNTVINLVEKPISIEQCMRVRDMAPIARYF